ncbi:MAG: asparagine synthase-related protein [Vicinamibacterales bacterium]
MLAAQGRLGERPSQVWSDANIALGARLTPRLPEDSFDRQPLVSSHSPFVLIADARLDNQPELTRALGIDAATASATSDADLILAALERWGIECGGRLIGDFAFAAWDTQRRRLLLARDPLGFRALHIHRTETLVAVSTTARGLHALPDVPYALDEDRLIDYLLGLGASPTRTFFEGIQRIKAGHLIEISADGIREHRFWNPGKGSTIRLRSPREYAEALLGHLDEAVDARLRGVSAVATHLSGGLDSSAVTTAAATLLATRGGGVTAYTSVPRADYSGEAPRDRIIDEGPYAAMTAAMYSNIQHVLIRSAERSPLDDLEMDVTLLEQPSIVIRNNAYVYSIADDVRRRGLRVLLTGGFGNAGWSYDGFALLPELVRSGRMLRWTREAAAVVRNGPMSWRGVAAASFGPWAPANLWVALHRVFGRQPEAVPFVALNPQRVSEGEVRERLRAANVDHAGRPFRDSLDERLSMIRGADVGSFTSAMLEGWGIDLRDPTADVRLLDFTLRVPTDQFFRSGVPKALTRNALATRLPAQVTQERRRGLQSADWHVPLSGARDRVRREVELLSRCPQAASLIDTSRLTRMVDSWPTDGWHREDVAIEYSETLLAAIAAGRFIRRVAERSVCRTASLDTASQLGDEPVGAGAGSGLPALSVTAERPE